ncbi:MAG: alpha/beta fold hydrolase [Gammaproteobacteria bacterium]
MRRIIFLFLLSLGVGASFAGAHRGQESGPPEVADGVSVRRDLLFSLPPEGALVLDLYRPAESVGGPWPVVLYIHGGGFKYGSKESIRQYADQDLPLLGLAVVSMNYRLSGSAKFPAQLADVHAALQWIQDSAQAYNLDAGRVALLGYSAGGTLASLAAVSAGYAVREGQIIPAPMAAPGPDILAVVDYFGPTDVLAGADTSVRSGGKWSDRDSMISEWFGFPILENPKQVATANPINYVSADSPPFLIIHGDQDKDVPLEQSRRLYAALRKAGADATLHIVKNGDHGRDGDFSTGEHQALKREFLLRHLKVE